MYRASFRSCLPIALVGALLSAVAGGYGAARVRALSAAFEAVFQGAWQGQSGIDLSLEELTVHAEALLHSPAVWSSYAAAALLTLICHAALIARQRAFVGCEPGSMAGALRVTVQRLPALLLTCVVLVFATLGGVLLMSLLTPQGAAVATLTTLLLSVLGVWLWGRLQLWLVAMIRDELGAMAALRQSWQAIEDHWWRASSLMTLPYLLIMAVSWGAQLLAGGIDALLGAGGALRPWVAQLSTLVAATLTLPVLPAVWILLYQQLLEDPKKKPRSGRG